MPSGLPGCAPARWCRSPDALRCAGAGQAVGTAPNWTPTGLRGTADSRHADQHKAAAAMPPPVTCLICANSHIFPQSNCLVSCQLQIVLLPKIETDMGSRFPPWRRPSCLRLQNFLFPLPAMARTTRAAPAPSFPLLASAGLSPPACGPAPMGRLVRDPLQPCSDCIIVMYDLSS